jgi:SAM-dependent methyltransferase
VNKIHKTHWHIAMMILLFIIALTIGGCIPPTPPIQTGAGEVPSAAASPQPATPDDRIARPVSEPYTGDLSIFEGKDRDRKLQIDRVMDILGVREGASVADIGAGSGWFTVRAARRVGERGQVYAVEINQDYLDYIARRAERESLGNIRTVLGQADDPRLPPASVDAVLILKTYHEVQEPIALLRHLRAALKPAGRLGIIDRNGGGGDHGIARDDVVREAERAAFRLVEEHDFVKPDDEDYFLVFELKG